MMIETMIELINHSMELEGPQLNQKAHYSPYDLIPALLSTKEEIDSWEVTNIVTAQLWASEQKDILSVSFMKELHGRMFEITWRWGGHFRQTDTNIGIHPSQIETQLTELCENVKCQIENNVYLKDEIAIRFAHKLVYIHPFVDGNGRHSRLMADLLFGSTLWNNFNREQYIQGIKCADEGDYSPLLKGFRYEKIHNPREPNSMEESGAKSREDI